MAFCEFRLPASFGDDVAVGLGTLFAMNSVDIDLNEIQALTFDVFGTVLDLAGSLTPFIAEFLQPRKTDLSADQ